MSCVSTKLHMSTLSHRVLIISVLFEPYHTGNTVRRLDTTCYRVILLSKLVTTSPSCVKSNKDRVVIVPHEFISMIHRLVLTTHLEFILRMSWSVVEKKSMVLGKMSGSIFPVASGWEEG